MSVMGSRSSWNRKHNVPHFDSYLFGLIQYLCGTLIFWEFVAKLTEASRVSYDSENPQLVYD